MSGKINISVNGQCQVPPGFRFHPTEEELLNYYLRKKVANENIDLDVIREVDINKLEPWDIQEMCRIGSTPQNDWYFFSHKDKKYPTGTRTNRATAAGFWKATGRDKIIYSGSKRIGLRKTLVFYKGRAPHGQKSDWIMHEYRLDEQHEISVSNQSRDSMFEDGWVICRVFKKKHYLKSLESPKGPNTSTNYFKSSLLSSGANDEVLDQILVCMGRSTKRENEKICNINISGYSDIKLDATNERFLHLPGIQSPTLPSLPNNLDNHAYESLQDAINKIEQSSTDTKTGWAALDQLVASQLNGQKVEISSSRQLNCFDDLIDNALGNFAGYGDDDMELPRLHSSRANAISQAYDNGHELWSLTNLSSGSSADPLHDLSI